VFSAKRLAIDPTAFFPLNWGKPEKADISHLLAFFQRAHPIIVFVPDSKSIGNTITSWLQRTVPLVQPHSCYPVRLKITLGRYNNGLGFDDRSNNAKTAQLLGEMSSRADGSQGVVDSPGVVSGHVVFAKETLLTWMKQRSVAPTLRFEGTPQTPTFADLVSVVDQVASSDLHQAASLLRDRRTLRQKDLSLFGFGIPGETALFVGPLAMLLGLVYLLEHIKHVQRLYRDRPDNAASFTWVAMFPGRTPAILTHFSIFGLTVAAMTGLLFRSFDKSSVLVWVGVSLSLSCVTTAIVICSAVAGLRRDITAGTCTTGIAEGATEAVG
jgi:hypothetical protein